MITANLGGSTLIKSASQDLKKLELVQEYLNTIELEAVDDESQSHLLLIKDWLNRSLKQSYLVKKEHRFAIMKTILSDLMSETSYKDAILKIGQ